MDQGVCTHYKKGHMNHAEGKSATCITVLMVQSCYLLCQELEEELTVSTHEDL